VNFQVSVLKILVSYPQGLAPIADLRRDMALLATSGRDWTERTKRLAARAPDLDIFGQGLVERLDGGWRITEQGLAVLDAMEAHPVFAQTPEPSPVPAVESAALAVATLPTASIPSNRRKREIRRRRHEQISGQRARAS
jgi:hypothetical protein